MPPLGFTNGDPSHPTDAPVLPPSSSIYESSSVAEIRATLAALHIRDSNITSQLQSLLSSQADLSRELGRLDLLRAHLGTQVINTRAISHGLLDNAADTAQTLSGKVKSLDLEKTRVEATLGVVEQVAELKACVQGVVGSMGAPQDWEAAAGYIARAGRIPEIVVNGAFAGSVVPSVEVPDAPGVTLENAKESLCGLFLREFEKAAAEGDGARVTRFFKLFPLIGRGDTGLDVYGRYVCQGVAATARKNLKEGTGGGARKEGFFYATALTKLFEHIAQIVEGHGSLVERHYGAGKMVKVVERLQVEADIQGGIILDTWGDERNVDRRLTDVKSYPFSFLVQSFLPAHRGALSMGTPRTGSPAVDGGRARLSEDEGVDMKEIDGLLSESAVMLGRWALYSRFLAGKCKEPDITEDATLSLPDFLSKSALSRKINSRLINPFNVMTTFFFRRSVEKAFQLDEMPTGLSLSPSKPLEGNPPYIISAVDDVMYIVNTVLQRSISTSQRDIIASVIPTVGRVLGSDFVGMIQRKMRDEHYPKALIQGGFPPEDKIIAFIVLINSLDVTNDYIARIVASRLSSSSTTAKGSNSSTTPDPNSLGEVFPFSHDAVFVAHALETLSTSFSSKTTELLNEGLYVLFNNVIKPRLRPVLADTFRDVDYTLTEAELDDLARARDTDVAEPDFMDAAARRFAPAWDALMLPLRRILSERAFDLVLDQTARYLARVLERRVWNYATKVNALGAVRLERDFAGIIGAICRGARYGLRELFVRVIQILTVLNMEDEEWEELTDQPEPEHEGEAALTWVLSAEERVRARGIVRD
ncbi:MAG: hypothetical protein M1818_004993 [Claussenomyces sp. TS43310]|nr:MAG: hypothetical protein M1818_004993 [Claussenomyces sp. TS43310]